MKILMFFYVQLEYIYIFLSMTLEVSDKLHFVNEATYVARQEKTKQNNFSTALHNYQFEQRHRIIVKLFSVF